MRAAGRTHARLRGVVFDLDGVIIDSHPVHLRAWRLFLERLGLPVPKDLNFVLDGRKRRDILSHFLGDLSEREIERYGHIKDKIYQSMQTTVKAVPGALRLIGELNESGIALAIASSASRERTLAALKHLGIDERFRVVVTGDDVAEGKPDPAAYRLACRRLKESKESLIAVEDAVSGIRAAKGAGLRCLAVTDHQDPQTLLAAGAFAAVCDLTNVSIEYLTRAFAATRDRQEQAS